MTDHYSRIKAAKEKELWDKIQILQKTHQDKLIELNNSLTGRAINRAQEDFSTYEKLRRYNRRIDRKEYEYWRTRSHKVAYSIMRLQVRWARKVEQIFRVD